MIEPPQTIPEVDRAIARLRERSSESVVLSSAEACWLLAEIGGGREAFAMLLRQKKGLEQQVGALRRTVDDLMAMRGK